MPVAATLGRWLQHWQRSLAAQAQPVCWVGFSGGMDSTVLLHGMAAVRSQAERSFELRAAHLDHALNTQSAQWCASCASLCSTLGIELVSERLPDAQLDPNQPGLEAAARAARYRFFERLLRNSGHALLLAHHSEDQAETVLLRMLQGRGVLPMPAERRLARGRLYRPLLQLPREALAAYAQAQGLNWIEDPSNRSITPDRNYLRYQVWPRLRERWPKAGRQLQRAAEQVGQSQAALAFLLAGRTALPLSWCEQPFAVALLRAWLAEVGEYGATDRALAEFVEQLQAAPERTPSLALSSGSLVRHAGEVRYQPHP